MAAPTLTGTPATTAIGTAATAGDFSLPATTVAGELLILLVSVAQSGLSAGVPAGWARMGGIGVVGGMQIVVGAVIADGTEGGTTVNVGWSNSAKACGICVRVSGHGYTSTDVSGWTTATNSPMSVGVSSSAGSTAPDPDVSDTTPSQDNLFLALAGWLGTATVTAWPTNYSSQQTQTASGGGGGATTKCGAAIAGHPTTATTSENPSAFTLSASNVWVAATIVLKPSIPDIIGSLTMAPYIPFSNPF
jgi:hypothetical protein